MGYLLSLSGYQVKFQTLVCTSCDEGGVLNLI